MGTATYHWNLFNSGFQLYTEMHFTIAICLCTHVTISEAFKPWKTLYVDSVDEGDSRSQSEVCKVTMCHIDYAQKNITAGSTEVRRTKKKHLQQWC